MKKILVIVSCLLAAGLAVWQFWPEYRSGYSEEQRRLWNARRELYPAAMVLSKGVLGTMSFISSSDIAELIGKDIRTTEKLLEQKQEKDKELLEALERNRDRFGADYQVKAPGPEDISRLPLQGLTRLEIVTRALSGDGDACLMMIQQILSSQSRGWGAMKLTWREKHEADKWLDRAIGMKRPGAVFIKNYLAKIRNDQVNMNLSRISSGGAIIIGVNPSGKDLEGYADFVENLKKGDFLLYQTAFRLLNSRTPMEEYPIIHEPLRRQAGRGVAAAQRLLAELHFSGNDYLMGNYFFYVVKDEVDKKKKAWKDVLGWFPDSWKNGMVKGLFSCGVIAPDRVPTLNNHRTASRYAQKAARQGDLTGMYLWVRFGITNTDRLSTEEWNDVLRYNRLLFESGYAPYMADMKKAHASYKINNEILSDQILKTYYSKKSYERLWNKDYLSDRGEMTYEVPEQTVKGNDLGKIRKMVDELCLTARVDHLVKELIDYDSNGWLPGCSKEVQDYFLEQLEKWSAEGDPRALYALAEIYVHGISVPVDVGHAYDLLKRALPVAEQYPFMDARMKNESGFAEFKTIALADVIRLRMADLVVRNMIFHGREEKAAYQGALKITQGRYRQGDLNYPVEVYRILGNFHERGVGMPVDKEKALEYYKKGAPTNKACKEGVTRLSPSDKSGENSGTK